MSRIVSIQTELRDTEILRECLEQLDYQVLYDKDGIRMNRTCKPVQFLVHAPYGTLGFRLNSGGSYELVVDDMLLDRQKELIDTLTQQYACRKVLKDAGAAGYQLVQQSVDDDQTIRLVVRKW